MIAHLERLDALALRAFVTYLPSAQPAPPCTGVWELMGFSAQRSMLYTYFLRSSARSRSYDIAIAKSAASDAKGIITCRKYLGFEKCPEMHLR